MRTIRPAITFTVLLMLSVPSVPTLALAQTTADKKHTIQLHATRAAEALNEKKPDAAIHEYEAILAMDPRNVDARANIGVIAFVQGKCEEAEKNFRQALAIQPTLWKVQAMLGLCEKGLGKPDSALNLLDKSFPHLQDPKLQTRAGMALAELGYQRGDLEKALAVLQVLQKSDPANPDILYVVYRIHSDLATQARDKLALVAPNSARLHQVMAQHLINEGDAQGAIAQYREALRIDPRLPGAHFELGEAILQDSSSDQARQEALEEFKTALAVNPADAKSECRLGALFSLRGDTDAALQHYSRAAELNPNEPEAQIGLGKILMSTGQPDAALEHLLKAVSLDPVNTNAHYRLSQLYRQLGHTADAEQEASRFRQLRDAEERLASAYSRSHRESGSSRALNPDIPQ